LRNPFFVCIFAYWGHFWDTEVKPRCFKEVR